MPALNAYRQLLYHGHDWLTVDRDERGEIQLCPCGAARRRPDISGEPGENGNPRPAEKDIP